MNVRNDEARGRNRDRFGRHRRACRCWPAYGDAPGANTIGNTARRVRFAASSQLRATRTRRADRDCAASSAVSQPRARIARLRERSRGKDTITGHWEMMGILTDVPFPTYPRGFPSDVVDEFARIAGKAPAGKSSRPRAPRSSSSSAPSTWRRAGRSSTPRRTPSFKWRRTKTSCLSPRSTTGAPARREHAPPAAQRQPGHRPPVCRETPGAFRRTPNRTGLCNRAASEPTR